MDVLELKLKEHGQEHLLQFWPSLCEEERNRLFNELNEYVSYIPIKKYPTMFKCSK